MAKKSKKVKVELKIDKEKVIQRLNRIQGQIRGIENMINDDADCIELLRQVNAITGAMRGVWAHVFSDHLKNNMTNAVARRDKEVFDELVEQMKNVR